MSYFKRLFPSSETGVTLILVLMLVAGVGLLVVPVMLLTASGLRATNLSEQRFMERYAVDAGIEDALWRIRYDPSSVVDGVPYFTGQDFGQTFNGLDPEVTITLAPAPPNPSDVPLTPKLTTEKGLTGYKTVNVNLVDPSSSQENFIYTLYLENYGSSEKENIDTFGDCLPEGFEFQRVLSVVGFTNDNWNDDTSPTGKYIIQAWDLDLESPYSGGLLPPTPVGGEFDDNASSRPKVLLSIDNTDSDFAHPCPSGRWQVKWQFLSPIPEIAERDLVPGWDGRAVIEIAVTVPTGLESGIYYNELWWESSSQALLLQKVKFTCEVSPVYARYAQWDITSSSGGTAVRVRATVQENLPAQPITILSWQVADGTTTTSPPPNSIHLGRLCGRGVESTGGRWEGEVSVTVHDENHEPVPNATINGDWSATGNGFKSSCTTDTSGKCLVLSGKLDALGVPAIFSVGPDSGDLTNLDNDTYDAGSNHMNSFTVTQPQP